jgi:hypothetical protein
VIPIVLMHEQKIEDFDFFGLQIDKFSQNPAQLLKDDVFSNSNRIELDLVI